jgi:predicted patatin/cPLA2 family phospholipase
MDVKITPVATMKVLTQFMVLHSCHVALIFSTSIDAPMVNIISFLGKKYIKVSPSAVKYNTKAAISGILTFLPCRQKVITQARAINHIIPEVFSGYFLP